MVDSLSVSCFRPLYVKNPRFRYPYNSYEYHRNRILYWRDYVENYYIEVPCGKCYLCRKKRANGWRIRLIEEIEGVPRFRHKGIMKYRCIFVCFTYDDAHLPKSDVRSVYAEHIKKWRDLWRKRYGRSPRYFATTDRGSQFGRLHFHFLIFNPWDYKKNKPLSIYALNQTNFHWRYGKAREPSWLESYKGITYVTGYMTGANLEKDSIKHGKPICKEALEYIPFIFCSNGLGASFLDNPNLVVDAETGNLLYRFNGYCYGLPSYYRYKLIDEEFRWHSNLIYKKEKEDYLTNTDFITYSFNGSIVTYDVLSSLYDGCYKRFDKQDNKKLKIYAKK